MVFFNEQSLSKFNEDGWIVILNFLTKERTEILKKEAQRLISDMPKPEDRIPFNPNTPEGYQARFDSCDKISYFYEPGVLKPNGELLVDPEIAVNKIGFGLHLQNEIFRRELFSNEVKQIMRTLGYERPLVIQSLLTFKNKKTGGFVPPHQDSTYMICNPSKIAGFYIALDDNTEENGCVWFLRGSHKDGPLRLMKRNPNKDSKDLIVFDKPSPQYDLEKFDAVPCKKGDLILFDGSTVHFTGENKTDTCRDAYVFQIMESKGAEWSKDSWSQPQKGFENLYQAVIA